MKKLKRILFDANKQDFMEYMLEDLYGQVPSKISQPSLNILQEQQPKVVQWYLWQAFVLQRRMVNSPDKAALIMGMLLQIKIELHMLTGGNVTPDLEVGLSPADKARADREEREREEAQRLVTAVEGAKNFAKGKQKQ